MRTVNEVSRLTGVSVRTLIQKKPTVPGRQKIKKKFLHKALCILYREARMEPPFYVVKEMIMLYILSDPCPLSERRRHMLLNNQK